MKLHSSETLIGYKNQEWEDVQMTPVLWLEQLGEWWWHLIRIRNIEKKQNVRGTIMSLASDVGSLWGAVPHLIGDVK